MYSFGIMMAEVVVGFLIIDSPVPQRESGWDMDSRRALVATAAARLASCPAFKDVIESCAQDDPSVRKTASVALGMLKDAVSRRCCHFFVYSTFSNPCHANRLSLHHLLRLTRPLFVDCHL